MPTEIKCVIADDEPLARKGLERFASDIPYLKLVAVCNNASGLLEKLKTVDADLLFLDIQMPGMSGLDLLRSGIKLPATILTTAFPEHALTAFEFDVVDYLVKPVSFERFTKAVNKAKEFIELRQRASQQVIVNEEYIFIKHDKRFEKVYLKDINYVQALHNYVVIVTDKMKYISYLTMKNMEEQLPKSQFMKVNKSYILPLAKINSVSANEVIIGSRHFAIGRTNRDQVLSKLLSSKVIRRK